MPAPFDQSRKAHSACFTGHRPRMLKNCRLDDLRLELHIAIQEAIDAGYQYFYCGMAMGSDIIAGELVVALREQFPEIRLIGVVPFHEQTQGWSQEWRQRYYRLRDAADEVVTLMPVAFSEGYLVRDRYMVEHSSLLIGVYNGYPRGGTAYTVRYARKRGLKIRLITPALEHD